MRLCLRYEEGPKSLRYSKSGPWLDHEDINFIVAKSTNNLLKDVTGLEEIDYWADTLKNCILSLYSTCLPPSLFVIMRPWDDDLCQTHSNGMRQPVPNISKIISQSECFLLLNCLSQFCERDNNLTYTTITVFPTWNIHHRNAQLCLKVYIWQMQKQLFLMNN